MKFSEFYQRRTLPADYRNFLEVCEKLVDAGMSPRKFIAEVFVPSLTSLDESAGQTQLTENMLKRLGRALGFGRSEPEDDPRVADPGPNTRGWRPPESIYTGQSSPGRGMGGPGSDRGYGRSDRETPLSDLAAQRRAFDRQSHGDAINTELAGRKQKILKMRDDVLSGVRKLRSEMQSSVHDVIANNYTSFSEPHMRELMSDFIDRMSDAVQKYNFNFDFPKYMNDMDQDIKGFKPQTDAGERYANRYGVNRGREAGFQAGNRPELGDNADRLRNVRV